MKKVRNLGLIIGLIILISSTARAQYFYTSYGYAHDWYIPQHIHYTISDHYYGYDIAHVHRYTRHGHTNFNVLLHRNGWFLEVRFDGYGRVYKTIRHRNIYPLRTHVCNHHCGYHRSYYNTYYTHYHPVHHHKTVYVNSYPAQKQQHNHYHTNAHVEKQSAGNTQTRQVTQKPERTSQERIIRVPEQNRSVQNTRSGANNRVAVEKPAAPARQTGSSQSGRTAEAYSRSSNSRGRQ